MTTRTCKKCKETKGIEEFPIYDAAKGLRRHECTACNRKRVEAHHVAHKAHRLRRARERYQADPSAVWTPERRAKKRELARVRYEEIRNKVYDLHGSECVACGETERLFLTIDHINNDGWQLRKGENGYREHGAGLYLDILRNGMRKDLEILCFNCNFGKKRNNGVLVYDRRLKGRCNDQSESS